MSRVKDEDTFKRNKLKTGSQKKFYSQETERRFNLVRDRNFASMRKRANHQIKEEGRKTLALYKAQGREAEFWETRETLLEKGVHYNMKVYDKEGNLIPLIDFEEKRQVKHNPKYDKNILSKVVERIINGDTLTNICTSPTSQEEGMPTLRAIRRWYVAYPEVARQLDQAYTERADYYVDQLYGLMDEVKKNAIDVKKGTFIADQIRWLAERLHPKFMTNKKTEGVNINIDGESKIQFQMLFAPPNKKEETKEVVNGLLCDNTEGTV